MTDTICPECGTTIPHYVSNCPGCIPDCSGKCVPEEQKCNYHCPHRKDCWKSTWPNEPWAEEGTTINLFDVTEAQIQRIMLDIRRIPKGLYHYWAITNPNADRSRQWSHILINVTRPTSLCITLCSKRLKYPGDPVCGIMSMEYRFVNITKAAKFLRRKVRSLQRQWCNNWPEGNQAMKLRRREYLWEHS